MGSSPMLGDARVVRCWAHCIPWGRMHLHIRPCPNLRPTRTPSSECVAAVLAGVENPHGLEEMSIGALYLFQVGISS